MYVLSELPKDLQRYFLNHTHSKVILASTVTNRYYSSIMFEPRYQALTRCRLLQITYADNFYMGYKMLRSYNPSGFREGITYYTLGHVYPEACGRSRYWNGYRHGHEFSYIPPDTVLYYEYCIDGLRHGDIRLRQGDILTIHSRWDHGQQIPINGVLADVDDLGESSRKYIPD